MLRPLLEQPVVVGFVSVNHVRDQGPVETWVPTPVVDPPEIALDVERSALFPGLERAVVEAEALADLGNDGDVVLARKRDQCMPPSEETRGVLASATDWGAVVVDHHAGNLTVSISTPW